MRDFDGDVNTINSLRDWLRMQPPDNKYDFFNNDGFCLLGQYYASKGFIWQKGISSPDLDGLDLYTHAPMQMCYIACIEPYTFGAALQRCNDILLRGRWPGIIQTAQP